MTTPVPPIQLVRLDEITVLNPRARNKRLFNELVASIAHLGLKKPITVRRREGGAGYDLVCGQGRLEAFATLGQTEIPAMVVDASEEDCYVMSLVENMARRQHTPLELMREIYALKERGYSFTEIAAKTDFSPAYVDAICYLFEHGEERLLAAIERGVLPHSVALEIVRANDGEVQAALADAYEKKALPGNQVIAIRRIIELRNRIGKAKYGVGGDRGHARNQVTADSLVRAYRKETERQRFLIKKATLTQSRLLFVVNALGRLLGEEHFVALLRAEGMETLPWPIAERIALVGG
jgi:ParB family transcriptional regulator, chromosome partitioning protein